MKSLKHVFLILLTACVSLGSYAQGNYEVKTSMGTYKDLVNPQLLTKADSGDGGWYRCRIMTLPVLGTKAAFNCKNGVSRGAFIAAGGYMAVYDETYNYTVAF